MKRWVVVAGILAAGAAAWAGSLPAHTVKRIASACVLIQVSEGGKGAAGSGFFVATSHVLTNHHVVKAAVDGEAKIILVIGGGTREPKLVSATVVTADEELDLALLRTDHRSRTILSFLPDRSLRLTEPVWVVGFPFGAAPGLEPTVTAGTISALRRGEDRKLQKVQIDAAVNRGNSGGPAVNASGKVVGVTRATINPKVGSGMAIAIPADAAKNFVRVAQRKRRRAKALRIRGRSSRRGLRVLKARKFEEAWGTRVEFTVRGTRGAEDADAFLVEFTDKRREVLKRDVVDAGEIESRQEKTVQVRLPGIAFKDVVGCFILD